MKQYLIGTALAVTAMMTGGVAQALTLTGDEEPPAQIPLIVTVGERDYVVNLDFIAIDPETNSAIYDLAPGGVVIDFTTGAISDVAPGTDPLENLAGDGLWIEGLGQIIDPTGSFNATYRSTTPNFTPAPFVVNFPFPVLTGLVDFTGDVAGSLTDGTPVRNGVNLSPVAPAGVVKYDLKRGATIVGTFSLGSAASFPAGPPDSHNYGPFGQFTPLTFNCGPLGCDNVDVTIAFSSTNAFNDRYGFTGRWDAVPNPDIVVPEPSTTVALVSLGLFSLTLMRRRQRF